MNKKLALKIILSILCGLLVFHFLIFAELIPYDKVWAGKLSSVEEMRTFETFSILINLFMVIVFSIKYRLLGTGNSNRVIDAVIWFFVVFFAVNSLGNLFSQSMAELILGTTLTLVLSVLCLIIVKKEKVKAQQ